MEFWWNPGLSVQGCLSRVGCPVGLDWLLELLIDLRKTFFSPLYTGADGVLWWLRPLWIKEVSLREPGGGGSVSWESFIGMALPWFLWDCTPLQGKKTNSKWHGKQKGGNDSKKRLSGACRAQPLGAVGKARWPLTPPSPCSWPGAPQRDRAPRIPEQTWNYMKGNQQRVPLSLV